MNSGILATGTETSFLMLPPSGFCASESDSRRRQKSRAWASELAMARVGDAARARWRLSQSLGQQPLGRAVRLEAGDLQQRVPGMRGGERIARARHVLQHEIEDDVAA